LRTQGLVALANESWITGAIDSPLDAAVQLIGEKAGFEPQVSHRLAGVQNICDLAATEVASAIVPRYCVPRLLRGLVVDDVVAGSRSFNVLVREGRLRDPKITAVLRELKEIAREVEAAAAGSAHLVVAS
jgi:DNA-binding transcriptional LysR family regulator